MYTISYDKFGEAIITRDDGVTIAPFMGDPNFSAFCDWNNAQENPLNFQSLPLRLAELDDQSIRALRAVAAGTATDTDQAHLAAIEAAVAALRALKPTQ